MCFATGAITIVISTLFALPTSHGLWRGTVDFGVSATLVDLSPVTADVKITPQSLNADGNGEALSAQISFERDRCSHTGVILETVTLRVKGSDSFIRAEREISRNKTKLIVRFDRQQVLNLIGGYAGDSITLEVRGEGAYACSFNGIDTIKFKPVDSESISVAPDGDGSTASDTTAPETSGDPPVDEGGSNESDSESGTDQPPADGGSGGESSSDTGDGGDGAGQDGGSDAGSGTTGTP